VAISGQTQSDGRVRVDIADRVIDRHHGSIRVSDNPGGGSRFTFTLPGAHPATPIISSPTGTGGRSIGA